MPDPRTLQRHVSRAILVLSVLGVLYLFWRFELIRLPRSGCSPLLRLSPGDLLLFDSKSPHYQVGDIVLFAGPGGSLHLGEIRRHEADAEPDDPDAVWVLTDRPDCPGLDSDDLGWIGREQLRGRMLIAR